MVKLIFFDMDGVLTEGSHVIELARIAGKEDELYEIPERISSKTGCTRIELEALIGEIVTLFAGLPESLLSTVGKRLPLIRGVVETVGMLKEGGYHPIIVTNGLTQIAGVCARRLGITEWYGNTLEVEEEVMTGHLLSPTLLTLRSKGELVREMVAQRSCREDSVAVGNDVNDWSMFREVGFSILFSPPSRLKERVEWYLDRDEKAWENNLYRSVDMVVEERDLRLLLPSLVRGPLVRERPRRAAFSINGAVREVPAIQVHESGGKYR